MGKFYLGRLGDNDKHYGPFTISLRSKRESKDSFFSYLNLDAVVNHDLIYKRDIKDCYCNTLTFHFSPIGSIRVILPFRPLRPILHKVYPKGWDDATVKRLGRDWYYDVIETSRGINISSTGFQIKYKGGTSSTIVKDWPWGIEHKETTYYHADSSEPLVSNKKFGLRDEVTNANYLIRDYDGETLVASAHKVRRSYYRTKGMLKWFGYLLPLKHFWGVDFTFSAETGAGKGSWKGGTIGSSVCSTRQEQLTDAMQRYCEKNGMVQLGFIGHTAGPIKRNDVIPTVQRVLPVYVNFLKPKTKEV